MATIVVKTQKEFDQLPESFKELTSIEIRSDKDLTIVVKKTPGNSTVWAYGNSTVAAYGSSTVRAYDSSTVAAYNSSAVWAYDSSTVYAYNSSAVWAYDSSTVWACNSSTVKAYNSSAVRACDSSTVWAYNSSTVRAYNSSTVRAYGSSTVWACGSSTVWAWGNSITRIKSDRVTLAKIKQRAVIILEDVKVKIPKKDSSAIVVKNKIAKHNITSFVEIYDLKKEDGSVILYKSVNKDTYCDFRTGKVKYEGIVECPDFDPDEDRECGGGLHLCATPEGAKSFADGPAKLLKCRVKLKDIVVFHGNIQKVRCKKVEVLGEV